MLIMLTMGPEAHPYLRIVRTALFTLRRHANELQRRYRQRTPTISVYPAVEKADGRARGAVLTEAGATSPADGVAANAERSANQPRPPPPLPEAGVVSDGVRSNNVSPRWQSNIRCVATPPSQTRMGVPAGIMINVREGSICAA